MESERLNGREIRRRFATACAIAHGIGAKHSANELIELVLEHGLPSREERERILAARLADGEYERQAEEEHLAETLGDNTTLSSSPEPLP